MIFITGMTGTSGSALYGVLCREQFKEKLKIAVRPTSDLSIFENSPLDIEFAYGDITDEGFLVSAMEGCDTVFHIAEKLLTEYVWHAIMRSPQIKYVILVSSTLIYSKYYPHSPLHVFEPQIRKDFEERGIKYVFIRPTMIFGTPKDRNISTFIRWFNKYPVFPIVSKGEANIQPVSRLDVAEGYYSVLKNLKTLKQTDYIVSGDREMKLIDMFRTITRLSNHKVRFFNVPYGFAKFCVRLVYILSFKKIKYMEKLDRLTEDRAYSHDVITEELGYSPMPFEDRVKPLIDEIKGEKK
ncbi:MAG: NmrA family NAD(P)-binding protein [Clostridia bacterium]|nr:NmrA family NAD(P)-binding protein [Clostridia bacterium]MBR5923737.1 NmrA family NAD(P)-binding protein [Clostridia bacterium]